MCGLTRLRKSVLIALIFYFHLVQFFQCEGEVFPNLQPNRPTFIKYARVKQLFPQISTLSKENDWHLSNNYDEFNEHPCKRDCMVNQSMTCYYYLVVHNDVTMGQECKQLLQKAYRISAMEYALPYSVQLQDGVDNACNFADGVKSEVMLVNGRLPGQAIEVCEGDTIVADVINSMQESTSIHWHGIHQRKTPHMDGVPHVTQYPVMPGQAFRYRFEADHAGTHWWHSHTHHQRAFGLAGPLVVRQPSSKNVHSPLYDFDLSEHTLLMQDWVHNYDETTPQNILINGLGRNVHKKPTQRKNPTVFATFRVVQGARYRFRAIFNGVANCPVSLSIDNHHMQVIASDGNDIEPISVSKIFFHGAERFDFVLHANQRVENYWIRVKGYSFCAKRKLYQEAILQYRGANRNAKPQAVVSYAHEATAAAELVLNPIEGSQYNDAGSNRVRIVDTNAVMAVSSVSPMTVLRTYYTSMSVHSKNDELSFQMDDITFKPPVVSLLQARSLGVDGTFCNSSSLVAAGRNCAQTSCACANVIQVPAFAEVEFVISSTSATTHPIHLHGYSFRVVGLGVLGESSINKIADIDRKYPLPRRKHVDAPLKDSVQVPGFGYTIIRFYTDNPGYWLFHCHISPHSERGMAAVVKVGEDTEMKLCPVSNCGLCGSVL